MRVALREAARGTGQTSPNPAVGALIVSGGKILARGFHHAVGQPHAEIEALHALRKNEHARGATLYVTLEPCSTRGRTPPCVDAIVAAGFARVVIGAIDPNPAHAGRAVNILRRHRIAVTLGVLEAECRELNVFFNKWIVTKTPFVIAKAGMSLDGRITRPVSEGPGITGPAARARVHRLRAQVDAILIGGETLRLDDPQLTVRGVRGARQPMRVIVSKSGKLPVHARVFQDMHKDRTLVYAGKSLRAVLRDLGRRDITSVLIEGGMRTLGEAFDHRLVDRVEFHVAPLLLAGPKVAVGGRGAGSTLESARLANPRYERHGGDLVLSGDVVYDSPKSITPASAA